MNKAKHAPLFHISKRKSMPWYKNWAVRGIAILLAVAVAAIVTMIMTGDNPGRIFLTMIDGAFGTPRRRWMTAQEVAILLCVSLALTPAFRMRFWNLGGEGQILMGSLACAACMILLGDKIPNPALIAIMVVTSVLAGAIWAVIPALFKAKWNTNETLFTLMMNYVALQLVAFYIIVWEVPRGSGKIGIINQNTEAGWLPVIGNQRYLLNILVVLVLTVILYIYLKRSKQGYEISVVGESERTARYVGIKVERVIIRTLFLSGAVCGIAGLLLVGGTNHTITTTLAGGRGFTAVMVAWLAKFNPIGMIFSSLLLVFFKQGAGEISTAIGLNQSYGDIMMGIVLFFIIGSEFFVNYMITFRGKSGKEAA